MEHEPAPLTLDEVTRLLKGGMDVIRTELTSIPAAAASWHPSPGEWCIKETLGHLIEAEQRGFAGRIRLILESDEPELPGWNREAVARERGDCRRDLSDLVSEFIQVREVSLSLVQTLQTVDLGRGGHHSAVGFLRVSDLLHEWIHHDRDHIRQMLGNVQAFAWPYMGNAQRFSAM